LQRSLLRDRRVLAASLFFVLMLAGAVTGSVRKFNGIPWWDMWGGSLGFYMSVQEGATGLWWQQHNEHRIVLSRVLFWLDNRFFGGIGVFLLSVGYSLAGAAAVVWWRVLRVASGTPRPTPLQATLGFFMAGGLFFWSQENNFSWAFQSQAFLACFLPLCALAALATAVPTNATAAFASATVLGVLSAGSMANGLLALPLMTLMAIVLRMSWVRIATLAAVSVAVISLYFVGYQAPSQHGSIAATAVHEPLALLLYVLVWLGNPMYFMLGRGWIGMAGSAAAGLVLVLGSAFVAWRVAPQARQRPLLVAALFFILYIGGTAVAVAGGRLLFGIGGAVASRYTTPPLMAWCAFLVLVFAWNRERLEGPWRRPALAAVALSALLMLVHQREALLPMHTLVAEQRLAALAATLDVDDPVALHSVAPASATVLYTTRYAVPRKESIFGFYPFSEIQGRLGTTLAWKGARSCVGGMDLLEGIPSAPATLRVHGWIYDPQAGSAPELVTFLDERSIAVGFALTGWPREDVARSIGSAASLAGFRGYLSASARGKPLTVVGDRGACSLHVDSATTHYRPD